MNKTIIPRALGALAGIALAGAFVATARPSAEVPSLPASASFTVPLSGELEVSPAFPRPVLTATGLRPGTPSSSATFSLANQTSATLGIDFRAKAAATGLDGLLRVRLSSGATVLADTTLQGLRSGSDAALELRSGTVAQVRIETWIPASIDSGYESRSAEVSLIPVLAEIRR
jgi:hypothetical protein